MLQVKDLHFSIADRRLLTGVNLTIQPGKRAALIGPNGAGKTTLLRILIGEIEYDSGNITKPKEYRIGYLPQEEVVGGSDPVLTSVLQARVELTELERKIKNLHHALEESGSDQAALLRQVDKLQQRYESLGGYQVEALAKKILSGLGFREADFSRPLSEFSGGWQMRSLLARLLIQEPDLLLLDEPTNHLDLPSLEWLENYLFSFKGSIVIVSHDRFFIDRLAQEIFHLNRGKLTHYSGNYHFYEKKREEQEALLRKKWEEQTRERQRQERFINRFRYKDSKATQVQSRIKQLEKMADIELPEPEPPALNFQLEVGEKSYREVLKMGDMWFRYEEEWVLRGVNLDIYRGDKLALVGPNGAGKTTLTRVMAGQFKPRKGTSLAGARVHAGYYAQHQVDALDLERTVYDEVAATVATTLVPRIRDVLGIFQLRGEDVNKKIKYLSGGEKARVSLAKILLSPVNFLIMDEPTNHLDQGSREALEKALSCYEGTLVLISHDRYFLDKIVNRVVEIQDGTVEEYHGNYTYYLEKRQHRAQTPPAKGEPVSAISDARLRKEQKRQEAEARQAVSKERSRLSRLIETLERQIDELEIRKVEIEAKMARPETYDDGELTVSLQKEYAQIKKDLGANYNQWETAHSELETLLRGLSLKNQTC